MSELATWTGHVILGLLSLYTILALRKHGIKFDIRIWRNGKRE